MTIHRNQLKPEIQKLVNQQLWETSDWVILINNSEDYIKMMKLALENKIFKQVMHNGHIAIELRLKSAISKEYFAHPTGHSIKTIVKTEIKNIPIFTEINKDANLQISFNSIYSAWRMQYRYIKHTVDEKEAQKLYKMFKEAYTWIRSKYCQ